VTPLLRASVAWHIAAALLTLLQPAWWPWMLGAVIADHLLLTVLGLWPRSHGLGSNWTRLPATAAAHGAVAITIDDGPDPEVTPRVLAILAEHRARATFFCIGERVEQHPELVRACTAQGHAIENHSQGHRYTFPFFGPARLRRELQRAQSGIEHVCGLRPHFFRAPAGLRSPLLDPVLQHLGLQLASWTRRGFDTVNADVDTILSRLTRRLAAGDILLLHDGHAARLADGRPAVIEVLPRLLEEIHRRGLHTVTLREAAGVY
jgi:peptidoglycan/xylan/chitin deacetylase (PgdA/CDA1 family)